MEDPTFRTEQEERGKKARMQKRMNTQYGLITKALKVKKLDDFSQKIVNRIIFP